MPMRTAAPLPTSLVPRFLALGVCQDGFCLLSGSRQLPPEIWVDVVRANPVDIDDALDRAVDPVVAIEQEAGHEGPAFGNGDDGFALAAPFTVENLAGLLVDAETQLRRQEQRYPGSGLGVCDGFGAVDLTPVDVRSNLLDGVRQLDKDRLAVIPFTLSLVDVLLLLCRRFAAEDAEDHVLEAVITRVVVVHDCVPFGEV